METKQQPATCRIAALLTSHNRRDKTIACIQALFAQKLPMGAWLDVYLVDDGSTDGTAKSVRKIFPGVHLITGDGSLFWNGGMRVAFAEAMRGYFDFYLWINDDTVLEQGAIATLLNAHADLAASGENAIVVGSTRDAAKGAHTYGGARRHSRVRPLRFTPVIPSSVPQRCDCMNGNCVLLPVSVVRSVGNLSPEFHHGMGDFDYGLRAVKLGCSVWVAPGYLGVCSKNSRSGTWQDTSLPAAERWKKLTSFKGLPPRDWFVFCTRHAGPMWPINWVLPYARVVVGGLLLHFA